MKIALIFALFYCTLSASEANAGIIVPCSLESSVRDTSLAKNESLFEFEIRGVTEKNFTIRYSVDGMNWSSKMVKNERLKVCLRPGKHSFQFYIYNYLEVYSSELNIKSQRKDRYSIQMTTSLYPVYVDKPVIYLYPKKETKVNVSLNIKGADPFFYPTYTDQWECTAFPNGNLQINDQVYNYLFWEANQGSVSIDHSKGFIVEKNEVVAFLEDKLRAAGFTSKEQADFITYWAPRMIQHERSFVHFIFNEECDDFAELNISPTPTNSYRMYILFQPTAETFEVEEQLITPMNREGFTILEWGGMEFPALLKNESL